MHKNISLIATAAVSVGRISPLSEFRSSEKQKPSARVDVQENRLGASSEGRRAGSEGSRDSLQLGAGLAPVTGQWEGGLGRKSFRVILGASYPAKGESLSKNCLAELSCTGRELSRSSTAVLLRHGLRAAERMPSLDRGHRGLEEVQGRLQVPSEGELSSHLGVVRASDWN